MTKTIVRPGETVTSLEDTLVAEGVQNNFAVGIYDHEAGKGYMAVTAEPEVETIKEVIEQALGECSDSIRLSVYIVGGIASEYTEQVRSLITEDEPSYTDSPAVQDLFAKSQAEVDLCEANWKRIFAENHYGLEQDQVSYSGNGSTHRLMGLEIDTSNGQFSLRL